MPTKPTGQKWTDKNGRKLQCETTGCRGARMKGTRYCPRCLKEIKEGKR